MYICSQYVQYNLLAKGPTRHLCRLYGFHLLCFGPAFAGLQIRVASSEISGNFPRKISGNFRKFILIFPEISGNLLNNFFHFIIFNYHHRKKLKISMFLTNNSPDLCLLTLCIKIRQNNLYLASLPRISANLNENYRRHNFQALTNISGNFRKY